MKKHVMWVLGLVVASAVFPSCKRKEVENKIIEGPSVHQAATILPAQAAQEFFLVSEGVMHVLVPILNRMSILNPSFTGLTGPDGQSRYSYTISESHYGTANIQIQFKDANGATIDPISTQTSTATVQSVIITGNGTSSLFTYSINYTLTLLTAGDVAGIKYTTGSTSFSGSGYAITYTLSSNPGPSTTFEGFIDGFALGSGSGGPSNQPTTVKLHFSDTHNADGPLTWEGIDGEFHFNSIGQGFVLANQARTLID